MATLNIVALSLLFLLVVALAAYTHSKIGRLTMMIIRHHAEIENLKKALAEKTTFKVVTDYLQANYYSEEDCKAAFPTKDEVITADQLKAVSQAVEGFKTELQTFSNGIPNLVTKDDLDQKLAALPPPAPAVAAPPPPPPAIANNAVTALQPRIDKIRMGLRHVVGYLRSLQSVAVANARGPLDDEIARIKASVADVQKGLKPLVDAKVAAEKKVADKKRALLPKTISKDAILKEAERCVPAGLDAADKLQAMAEHAKNRDQIVAERQGQYEDAQRELEEATTALNEFKASTSTSDADAKIAELRKQLAAFDELERDLVAIETAIGSSNGRRVPTPPRPNGTIKPASPAPPPDGFIGEDEVEDDPGGPSSVDFSLRSLTSAPPPALPVPTPPPPPPPIVVAAPVAPPAPPATPSGRLPAPPKLPEVLCPSCSSPVPVGSRFCNSCGTEQPRPATTP